MGNVELAHICPMIINFNTNKGGLSPHFKTLWPFLSLLVTFWPTFYHQSWGLLTGGGLWLSISFATLILKMKSQKWPTRGKTLARYRRGGREGGWGRVRHQSARCPSTSCKFFFKIIFNNNNDDDIKITWSRKWRIFDSLQRRAPRFLQTLSKWFRCKKI